MRSTFIGSAMAIGLFFMTAPALAATTTCSGTLSGGTYENVVVPDGAICNLFNVTINGNVLLLEDSKTFIALATINGNVAGADAEMLQIQLSTVTGNVSIVGGEVDDTSPFTFDNALCGSHIYGNVEVLNSGGDVIFVPSSTCGGAASQIDGNLTVVGNSARVRLWNLTVGENMTVENNTGPLVKDILNNAVGKILTCSGNEDPFSASGNTAGKKINGQCQN